MFRKLLHIAAFLALATVVAAQNPYLPGTLQGGPPAPGTKSRSPLNSLERAANNRPGATILTDTFGNMRFAEFVEINLVPINYLPTSTGNTQNLSEFVISTVDTGLYFIDWRGYAIKFGGGGGLGVCDADWLTINGLQCPLSINDSIFTYKYASVGARLVWPTAEFLVNDSTGIAVQIISGSRNARLGFYDNQNQVWSTIDQSGTSTLWYIDPDGEFRIVTSASGSPQNPGGPFVNQFGIDPNDSPLPTIQAYEYPNTRIDTNAVLNFVYTDPVGKLRVRPLDSLFVIIIDSIGNWYTRNGTTTEALRTATILESAEWLGDAPDGYLFFQMGTLSGGRLRVDTAAALWHSGLGGANRVQADAQGVDIMTSSSATRAVNIQTDTVNWASSFDPTLQIHNLKADETYFYADSNKVVGIGQFPAFPSLAIDGTDKGFYYSPSNGSVAMINGEGNAGAFSGFQLGGQANFSLESTYNQGDYLNFSGYSYSDEARIYFTAKTAAFGDTTSFFEIFQSIDSPKSNKYVAMGEYEDIGQVPIASIFLGQSVDNTATKIYSPTRSFGVQQYSPGGNFKYTWLNIELPTNGDTTINAISFYNNSYLWKNALPSTTIGDTSFHFWAGTGSGTDPGFMTLDQICAHCSENAVNWYNSNGITTENTRIADVLETATWRSADVTVDGIFPFRFELDGESPNEPEMMVWKFPIDSLTLGQSDQEIYFRSTNELLLQADGFLVGLGDSVLLGHLANASGGDIVALAGSDGAPGNTRTLKSLEGTFDADVLSWSAGSAGDRWDAVPANRSSIVVTVGTGTTTPSISVENILIDGAGGGTVSLNYTPSMPGGTYTTVRYIYNEGGDAAVTVNTNQSWQFRNTTGDLGTSFSLNAGDNAKLIWIYDATASNARFFVILF